MPGMNKDDWNDCNRKEQIVNKTIHLNIVVNKVKKTIEQGNKEVRTCTQNLLKTGGNDSDPT